MAVDAPRPHPLDNCDDADCYQTMMSERTALITARREAEDNLVKTVIQLASALLVLLAGFVSQSKLQLSFWDVTLFALALAALGISIIAGLWEHRFASQAYAQQQKLVEDYFQKKISEFSEPAANESVRKAQTIAFVSFVSALMCLSVFAFFQARESYVESQRRPTFQATTANSSSGKVRRSERLDTVGSTLNAAAPTAEKVIEN